MSLFRQILTFCSIALMLGCLVLSSARVVATGVILPPPGMHRLVIEPAGYTFWIWALVYGGMALFALYQLMPGQRLNPRFHSARPWIALNALANSAWLLAASDKNCWITATLLAAMLFTLVLTSRALDLGKGGAPTGEILTSRLPVSLYFGWVTALLPIHIAYCLFEAGALKGLDPQTAGFAVLILILVTAILTYFRYAHANFCFALAIVWTLVGIGVGNLDKEVTLVFWTAAAGAFFLFLLVTASLILTRHKRNI